jgi:predicted ATPase
MDLCGKPFSAADYLEITKQFGTVFLLDVPKMGLDRKDLVGVFIFFTLSRRYARPSELILLFQGTKIYYIHRCVL